jgi:hypothetical protein
LNFYNDQNLHAITAIDSIARDAAVAAGTDIHVQATAWMDSRTAAKYLGFDKMHAFKTLERYARESKLPGYFRFNRWYFLKGEQPFPIEE